MKIYSLLLTAKTQLERLGDFLWAKVTGAPALYRSQVNHHLFVGGQYSKRGLARLKAWDITAVVSMRSRVPALYTNVSWLKVLHLPTPDRHAPEVSQLLKGIDFIKKEVKKGGKVYVHCFWGEGRGPSMAIAYLISTGMTLEQAVGQVKKVRTFIGPTAVQLARLKELELFLNRQIND